MQPNMKIKMKNKLKTQIENYNAIYNENDYEH